MAAILLFDPAPAFSDTDRSPAAMRKSSSAELPMDDEFRPIPGTYHYDVYLNNLQVGKATIETQKDGEDYIIRVTARTRGVWKRFYRVKYKGEAAMNPNPIQPRTATIEEQTGSKKKSYQIQFPQPDKVTATQVKTQKGRQPKQTTKEFDSESFVLDPFSTVFLVRSLQWEVGYAEVFDIIAGKRPYELRLLCQGERVLEVNGEARRAWEIIPQTRTLSDPPKVKLSGFTVYLSQDSRREILKITGDPKIGRIVARMRKFKESAEIP